MIEVRGLHKHFATRHVLQGIDLAVERGESMVILGGSGSGKSVLMRHLVALYRPDEGTVTVDDVNIHKLSKKELFQFRRRFGMSFQEGALFDSMTAYENVAFPIRRWERKLREADVRERVAECLTLVGLPNVGPKRPSELSGGMRRRVGFARAIALKPEIVLFDEPTTGLDPIMTAAVDDIIIKLKNELNVTAVTITHDLKSARAIADRVAFLHQGRILVSQTAEAFFGSEPEDPVVEQFIKGRAQGPATEELIQ